ncbi:hypothetical protein CDD83_10765 [Cordyceps sp. RAO-2017]|nr:hypothetical protein CDD83_10765 [Cordyceps sp. RAO-2017]
MNMIGFPHHSYPKTYAAAVSKAITTRALDADVISRWGGMKDFCGRSVEIDGAANDRGLDYVLNAPLLLTVLMLRYVRNVGGTGMDTGSRIVAAHKMWIKLPTAIKQWETGNTAGFFPMVCPPCASSFEHGSQMETYEKRVASAGSKESKTPASSSDENDSSDETTDTAEAPKGKGPAGGPCAKQNDADGRPAREVDAEASPALPARPALNAELIDRVRNDTAAPQMADERMPEPGFVCAFKQIVTRQDVMIKLDDVLKATADSAADADHEGITNRLSALLDEATVAVVEPVARLQLFRYIAAHKPDMEQSQRLRENLATDRMETTVSVNKTVDLPPLRTNMPPLTIADDFALIGRNTQPQEISNFLSQPTNGIRAHEMPRQNSIQEHGFVASTKRKAADALEEADDDNGERPSRASAANARVAPGAQQRLVPGFPPRGGQDEPNRESVGAAFEGPDRLVVNVLLDMEVAQINLALQSMAQDPGVRVARRVFESLMRRLRGSDHDSHMRRFAERNQAEIELQLDLRMECAERAAPALKVEGERPAGDVLMRFDEEVRLGRCEI